MKIYLYIFLSLFIGECLISQEQFVSISGIVTSTQNNENVTNALIHLQLTSGLNLETKTDSAGHYEFRIKNDTASNFVIKVASDKFTTSKSNKKWGFLANKDFGKGKLNGNISFVKNFQLTYVVHCGPLAPTILFYKHSIISCNDSLSLASEIKLQ